MTGRRWWAAVFAIALAGGALRVAACGRFRLNGDEKFETLNAPIPWPSFWEKLRGDAVHPPLDYLVQRAISPLHPGPAQRRWPSAVWGTASIVLLAALARRCAGEAAGALAALFLALSPSHLMLSALARPYALGIAMLLASLLCLERWLEKPATPRLALLLAAALATAYTEYLAALILAVAGTARLAEEWVTGPPQRRETLRRLLRASPLLGAGLLIAYLPWLPVVATALRSFPVSRAPLGFATRGPRILAFVFLDADDGWGWRPRALFFAGLAVASLLAAVGAARAARRPGQRWLLGWGIAGTALVELLQALHPHFGSLRYDAFSGFGLVALAAIGVAGAGGRRGRLAGAALAAALAAAQLRGVRVYFRRGVPGIVVPASAGRTKTTSWGRT